MYLAQVRTFLWYKGCVCVCVCVCVSVCVCVCVSQMSAQELTALARDAADILACPDYTGPHALDALARSPPSQSPHRPALFCQRDVPCVASKPRERRAYEKCSAHSSPTALASTGNRGGRSVPGLDGASMHEGEPLHAVFRAAAQRALVLVPNLHMPVAAEMTYQITRVSRQATDVRACVSHVRHMRLCVTCPVRFCRPTRTSQASV